MTKRLGISMFAVLAAALCAVVPMRVYELLYSIEPLTGFYRKTGGLITAVNVLLLVATLLLLAPILFRNADAVPPETRESRAGSVLCCAVAVCFLLAGAEQFYSLIRTSKVGAFLISVTELLSAVFFFLLGAKRGGSKVSLALPALLPVLWGIVILIVLFMQYTTIASISGYLFDVLKMVFMLVFLYYHAISVGNLENRRGMNGIAAFGLPAVLYCVVTSVPDYIAHALNPKYGSLPTFSGVLYLVLAVYIVYTVAETCFTKNPARTRRSEDAGNSGNAET